MFNLLAIRAVYRYVTHYVCLCMAYSVHCTVYNVHYTLYSVQCTVYNAQCTAYIIRQRNNDIECITGVLRNAIREKHNDGIG